jgi:hypothetical protein
MRLPIIPPAELNAEQKPLYDDMRDGITKNFQGFINIRDDSALLGPWNPWIHEPTFGKPGADESDGLEPVATGQCQRDCHPRHRGAL